MSIATQIERIIFAKNKIRDKMVELGLVTATAKIDVIATAVEGIANKGAVSASVSEGETYTIPKGYHNGSGTVSGVSGGGGYNLQSKTATPTKTQQNIVPDDGYFGLSDVTVGAIPGEFADTSDATADAANILFGKTAYIYDSATQNGVKVAGTMTDNGAVSGTFDGMVTSSFDIPAGYTSGGTVSLTDDIEAALAAI